MFVYRSTQFKRILADLLDPVACGLSMLSHTELVPLLEAAGHFGTNDERFKSLLREMMPQDAEAVDPAWDLVIVDDWNQSDGQLKSVLGELGRISLRSVVLCATDQVYSAALSVDEMSTMTVGDYFESELNVNMPVVEPPGGYHVVSLESNLRNARHIASYIARVTGHAIDSAVKSSGYRRTELTTWDTISADIVHAVQQALEVYDPGSIKILCDPHLHHPALLSVVLADLPQHQSRLAAQLDPLAGAILKAAGWSGLTKKTMSSEKGTAQLDLIQKDEPIFAVCDGQNFTPVNDVLLRSPKQTSSMEGVHENEYRQRVDAHAVLNPYALEDPYRWYNMVMIYDASLFIGMEADMVIYVRNKRDVRLDSPGDAENPSNRNLISRARKEQHLVGMTRAKHHLVDMIIADT